MGWRRGPRALSAGLITGLVLAASACGQQSPSVVAYVGNDTITEQELDSAYPAVAATLADVQEVPEGAVINVMIYGELAEQIAERRNIEITDAQRDQVVAAGNLTPLLANEAAKPIAYDIADQQIVAGKIGAQAFLAEVASIPVKLNPRYGVLDPQQKIIAADRSSSLSTPAAPAPPPQ